MPDSFNPHEAIITYDKATLVEKLGLPADVTFEAAFYDVLLNELIVRISGKHLPVRLAGELPVRYSHGAFEMRTRLKALSDSKE